MIAQQLQALADDLPSSRLERKEIYLAARDLMLKTESKYDTQNRICYAHITSSAAAIGMQMGIFRILASEPRRDWSTIEIAEKVGAEHDFLLRIMRILAAYGMLDQMSATTYKASNITETLALDSSEKTVKLQYGLAGPWIHALPRYLEKHGYHNPNDSTNTAFHMGQNTTMSQMEFIQSDPAITKMFFDLMPIQRADQISWMDQPGRILLRDFEMSRADVEGGRAVFVDVGGGAGHQCIALREKRPDIKGRVVLQDVAMMAEHAAMDPRMKELGVEVQTHDFHTPQAEGSRGAKVYYLRTVLHDWTDGICGSILKQLRDAMADDSVVVLDEKVVPEVGMDSKMAVYDMMMMAFVSAKERTQAEWSALLSRNGLNIRDVVCYDDETKDCLVFAVKA